MTSIDYKEFLAPCVRIAKEAGGIILGLNPAEAKIKTKPDGSPVSDADEAADEYCARALQTLMPGIPVVSEEGNKALPEDYSGPFWLVDGLDNSNGWLRGSKEYTVNIALIDGGKPVLGVIYAPASKTLYYGLVDAQEAYKQESEGPPVRLKANNHRKNKLTAVVSQQNFRHTKQEFLNDARIEQVKHIASSLKFGLLADGRADIYPRFGGIHEWDIAAGHAIVKAAGGNVVDENGGELTYGRAHGGFRTPSFYAYIGEDAWSFLLEEHVLQQVGMLKNFPRSDGHAI